jgi:hypothetical protein
LYHHPHQLDNGETEVDLSAAGLAPGMYIMRVAGPDGKGKPIKLLKQ